MTKAEGDARVGGTFEWEWSGPEGAALRMTGVNREVTSPERCTRTEAFELIGGPPMGEHLATVALDEIDGWTRMTVTIVMHSKEARDGALASGMTEGMGLGYERLDGLLMETTPRRSDELAEMVRIVARSGVHVGRELLFQQGLDGVQGGPVRRWRDIVVLYH